MVVDARCDARCGEVEVTSCNSHVMHSMRLVPTLADALADCSGARHVWAAWMARCLGCMPASATRRLSAGQFACWLDAPICPALALALQGA